MSLRKQKKETQHSGELGNIKKYVVLADPCYSCRKFPHPIRMKTLIKQVLLATCLIGAPSCVFAYPFNPNPQSFQNYLNAVKWKNGSKVYFNNLNECRDAGMSGTYYNCRGFVTISDPMGTKICELGSVVWNLGGHIRYTTRQCRYK